jgi:hypothetical protein
MRLYKSEVTKRSQDNHQRLKLGVAIIASITVTGVLGMLMILASIQVDVFTPPL